MEYRNPKPTVDVIVECDEGIVLIWRKNPPIGWALPGGFVDEWEPVEQAAVREVQEETGLHVRLSELLYVYSDPSRDPRQHTITVAFIGQATGTPVAADDATRAEIFPIDRLPSPMVFDHAKIIEDYRTFKLSGRRPCPDKN